MQMGHESMQHDGHGGMQQDQDAGMRHESDAGMQHDHMGHGASEPGDAGSTMPEHHQHQGTQPAAPVEARDGGSP